MSKSNTHINDDLLVKYLVGEAAPGEAEQVNAWINASERNKQYFGQLKSIWDQSLLVGNSRNVDEDAAYTRLQSRIKAEQQTSPAKVKQMRIPVWLSVAASIMIICSIGYFTWDYFNRRITVVTLQSGVAAVTDTLPDGSVITLNAASKLAYPDKFKGDTRQVSLLGEAFFKVTPDKTKPFIIKVNDVTVRVVGTSFNVKSRNGKTEVVVETGIVNVSKANNSLDLTPGQKTEVTSGSNTFSKQQVSGNLYSYYVNKELFCNQTPLKELVDALNDIYGAHIVIANPRLQKLPITTVFKDQSLNQVLAVISDTFKISVEHKNGRIILK